MEFLNNVFALIYNVFVAFVSDTRFIALLFIAIVVILLLLTGKLLDYVWGDRR